MINQENHRGNMERQENKMKFFISERYRSRLTIEYVIEDYNEYKDNRILYDSYDEAWEAKKRTFYDDSDVAICSIDDKGNFHIVGRDD